MHAQSLVKRVGGIQKIRQVLKQISRWGLLSVSIWTVTLLV